MSAPLSLDAVNAFVEAMAQIAYITRLRMRSHVQC